jgi:tRNA pseudouridine38-40 synthase
MVRNLLFTIEYDGSDFHGWQRQPNVRTVQGALEEALGRLFCMRVEIDGTSRTDAGVHAIGQRASFAGTFGIPTDRIKFAANNMLPDSIHISKVEEVPERFHARFDATGKTYRYVIRNTQDKNVFDRNYCLYVGPALDLEAMKAAALQFVGTHDFKSCQASGGPEKLSTVRTISELEIDKDGDKITIEVTGDGFLYNMVRIISGTLVEVGLGRIRPDQIKDILLSKDRAKAGYTAPPQGLYLVQVYYEREER